MSQINKRHLEFMDDCRHVFSKELLRETHINKDGDLIGLRYGADRDCIRIFDLGKEVGFFAQMIHATDGDQYIAAVGKVYDKDLHELRPEIGLFAEMMEQQLRENDHKCGWLKAWEGSLIAELERNLYRIKCTSVASVEYQRRCANIANYAMMLADKDRREEKERAK